MKNARLMVMRRAFFIDGVSGTGYWHWDALMVEDVEAENPAS